MQFSSKSMGVIIVRRLHTFAIMYCNCVCVSPGPYPHLPMIFKELRMEGFLVGRWEHKNEESLRRLLSWLQEASSSFL